jgi:hypothetical protein
MKHLAKIGIPLATTLLLTSAALGAGAMPKQPSVCCASCSRSRVRLLG